MQKCQPRGSVTWTLISVMASNGVVKVACVAGAGRGGKRGEINCAGGGSGRKGEEGSHAGLLTPFYNDVECKLRTAHEFRVLLSTQFMSFKNDIN